MENKWLATSEERWLTFLSTHSTHEDALKQATILHLGYVNALYDTHAISLESYEKARAKVTLVMKKMKWEDTIMTLPTSIQIKKKS